MKLKLSVAIVILSLAWLADVVTGVCDPDYGPAGAVRCVLLTVPSYSDYQWGTCVSNSYIKVKSKGQYSCALDSDYCYDQCMVEMYGKTSGDVYGKCQCNPGDAVPGDYPKAGDKLDHNNDNSDLRDLLGDDYDNIFGDLNGNKNSKDKKNTIAEWCASPDGTKCTWFSECLDKKYPCTAAGNGYTLDYAENFCSLYEAQENVAGYLSPPAKQWLNAVRKCLQVDLVPLLRPWMSPTCKDIKQNALDSHSHCYYSAYAGAPSICDLGCLDWGKIFWNVKSNFQQSFIESMKSVVKAMSTCGQNVSIIGTDCPSEFLRLTLNYETSNGHHATDNLNALDQLAGKAADQLAKRLKWDSKVMDWFALAPNVTGNFSKTVTIDVILGDKIALGLSRQQRSKFSLANVANDFADALKKGLLYDLNLDHGKMAVSTLKACEDMQCGQTFMNATAGPRPLKKNFATSVQAQTLSIWVCAVLVLTAFFI